MDAKKQHADLVRRQRLALDKATTNEKREIALVKFGPLISMANSEQQDTGDPEWHTAPDGTQCCCTAEDRQYGCGCL